MLPTHKQIRSEARLYHAFTKPLRLLILYALYEKPHNVTNLTRRLRAPQPKVSHHLKILRDLRMVKATRQGTTVTYEIENRQVIDAMKILLETVSDKASGKSKK